MQDAPQFAFTLSQVERGWTWKVYDELGETVASGADLDRQAAMAAVNAKLASNG
jgi:hypothetical protein